MKAFRLKYNKKGFTVIELIAVIVILGICLAPISVAFYHVMAKHAEPEAIQVAVALAEQQMERVTGMRFSLVVDDGPTVINGYPSYTYQVIVTTLAGQSNQDKYKQIEVRIVNSTLGVTTSLFTIMTVKRSIV